MNVIVTQRAIKDLKKLDKTIKKQVKEALNKLYDFPDVNNIKQLKGNPVRYRLRVRDWRIIFIVDWESDVLTITSINHRREVYR